MHLLRAGRGIGNGGVKNMMRDGYMDWHLFTFNI